MSTRKPNPPPPGSPAPLPSRHVPARRASAQNAAQRRILAAWRGVDTVPLEVAQTVRARGLDNVLPGVLSGVRIDRRQSEAEVVKVWQHIMDPNILAHAQPTALRRGTLTISVDSNVWLSELVRYRRKEILERLQHAFGPELIVRLQFRVG